MGCPRLLRAAVLPAVATMLVLGPSACERRTAVAVEVEAVELEPGSFTLVEGATRSVQAVARGPGGVELSDRPTDWSTDDPGVATVDGSGTVQAVGPGETVVRATVEGVEGSASLLVERRPVIAVTPGMVHLTAVAGESSGSEIVSISNAGGSVLSGLAVAATYPSEEPPDWLVASLDGSTAPAELTLSASATSLGAGSYQAEVVVASSLSGVEPVAVAVELTVEPPPPIITLGSLEVSLTSVAGVAVETTVSVTNGGGGILSGLSTSVAYREGEPEGWLDVSLELLTAPTGLGIRANPGELPAGTYHATVTVGSELIGVAPVALAVEFEVDRSGSP